MAQTQSLRAAPPSEHHGPGAEARLQGQRGRQSSARLVRNTVRTAVYPGTIAIAGPCNPFGPPAQESTLAKLHRLERTSGSNLGGVRNKLSDRQPSLRRMLRVRLARLSFPGTCRNGRDYKTYVECTETSHFLAWRPMEYHWYCTSLAFKK